VLYVDVYYFCFFFVFISLSLSRIKGFIDAKRNLEIAAVTAGMLVVPAVAYLVQNASFGQLRDSCSKGHQGTLLASRVAADAL